MGDNIKKSGLGRFLAALRGDFKLFWARWPIRRRRFANTLKSLLAQLAFFCFGLVTLGIIFAVLFTFQPLPPAPKAVLGSAIVCLTIIGFGALWLLKSAPHLKAPKRAQPSSLLGLGLLVVIMGAGTYALIVV